MDRSRDLARYDPWQESLERSRARRARTARPSTERSAATFGDMCVDVVVSARAWCERAVTTRSGLPRLGPKSVAALALLAAIVASSLAHGGPQDSSSARADVPAAVAASNVGSPAGTGGVAGARSNRPRGCPLAVTPAGYVNPLRSAFVKPERIDQGVDYAGSGTLVAMGAARISYLATSGTGWPGAFIEYQLLDGANAGCFVFYAEGVIPADGLYVGETLNAGQPIATIIPKYPTGIEIGWGAGISTKAYAKVAGQWSATDDQDNVASPAGRSFSALIAALGGPPGKVEG